MASVTSAFGLRGPRFASPADKRTIDAVETGLERLEAALDEHLRIADPVADAVARYLKEAGGKRARPLLLMLAAHLGKGIDGDVLAAAEVVEITHLASLYHDDVMDEADTRRGVPAAHVVWSNSVAILAGDLLFARAGAVAAPLGAEVAKLQARTFERLCLGQLHETLGAGDTDPVEHYLQVLGDKTGSLIAAAAELGVLVSGAEAAYRQPLREFGERIGVAFQLVDDVIDLSADPATGKDQGNDVRAGVATLPVLLLAKRDDAASLALRARLASPADDADLAAAIAELAEHPVVDESVAAAEHWQRSALDALRELPGGTVRRALEAFAEHVVSRTR
ncbi:polyprenyl synthetase family protein [Agrococcus sp. ARC_14]|uniref:polyprenyl synthetase family protein n=1 Tax=Agrococcus sp. ARC_14 TaxID=2919927 RepID=UPI001F06AF3A|nr:polyprenyl synthetase family protein [Agrococcus sp. ARC_14]MCH1882137.1 polyprenyl synthetase family protein [Agrococcus sp. ARC_14]